MTYAHSSNYRTPESVVAEYFSSLIRQVERTSKADESVIFQEATLAIILAVSVAEIFLNLYFRVIVSEPDFKAHEDGLLNDLARRISLDWKLKRWRKRILGKGVPPDSNSVKQFMALKNLRNDLVHFTSTHSSVHVAPNLIRHGMVETGLYSETEVSEAKNAPLVV